MSNVKVFYTKTSGIIIGEVKEDLNGASWKVTNPNSVYFTEQHIGLHPIHQIVTEDYVTLTQDDINFGQAFTPHHEIVKSYLSQYDKLQVPDNKLHLL